MSASVYQPRRSLVWLWLLLAFTSARIVATLLYFSSRNSHDAHRHVLHVTLRFGFIRVFFVTCRNTPELIRVKLGVDVRTGETVAVKIMYKDNMSARAAQQLRREITSMKALNHPNVLRLKDVHEVCYRAAVRHGGAVRYVDMK